MVLSAAGEIKLMNALNVRSLKVYATADVFYSDALVEVNLLTGLYSPLGTSGAGAVFAGVCDKTKTTAAASSSEIEVDVSGRVIKEVAVAGVSAETDVGKLVYCTSDDAESDMTLTRAAADSIPVGRVDQYSGSGTTCDVKLFSLYESMRFALSGGGRKTICLGTTDMNTVVDGDVFTNVLTFTGSGKIVGFYAMVGTATTDGDADATLNLEINTTDLTGGTIVLGDTGDATGMEAKGSRVDSAAITANNVFHDGDTLSVEAASVTDYTDGQITLFIVVEEGL